MMVSRAMAPHPDGSSLKYAVCDIRALFNINIPPTAVVCVLPSLLCDFALEKCDDDPGPSIDLIFVLYLLMMSCLYMRVSIRHRTSICVAIILSRTLSSLMSVSVSTL